MAVKAHRARHRSLDTPQTLHLQCRIRLLLHRDRSRFRHTTTIELNRQIIRPDLHRLVKEVAGWRIENRKHERRQQSQGGPDEDLKDGDEDYGDELLLAGGRCLEAIVGGSGMGVWGAQVLEEDEGVGAEVVG